MTGAARFFCQSTSVSTVMVSTFFFFKALVVSSPRAAIPTFISDTILLLVPVSDRAKLRFRPQHLGWSLYRLLANPQMPRF